jgi:glycosyltransferase involved in cell wall biosynthesis
MRLGVIYQPGSPNAQYRAIIPMQALEQRGHAVVWPTKPNIVPREFLQCDLVHCYRHMSRIEDLRRLSARGVAISFDNDDNFVAAEISAQGTGLDAHRQNKRIAREMRQAAMLADVTTTTSELLAESYRVAGADNVVVIGNHLPSKMSAFGSKAKHEGIVVGWVAGGEHRLDLERIPIAQALERLLETHPQLRVLTVGERLPLHSPRYEHIVSVPFIDLLKITSRMDIGIAPLADTAFNRSRSDVKLKEYSSGVTTWLASPVGPYRELGEKQGGSLVGDDDWFVAIDELVRNPRKRKRRAKAALKWAKAETIEHYAADWESEFVQARERAKRRVASPTPRAMRAARASRG